MVAQKKEFPTELVEKIKDFMASRKTGKITLDFHEGRINTYQVTEWGKVNHKS